jgi:iron complex outermembrane recepter protein
VQTSIGLRLFFLAPMACSLAAGQSSLADASLEQLLATDVTSVSKKEQKLAQAAAAIYVIHQEDIRRSGATNLPDVLRLAPGVDVARINANSWAISIRGFNHRYSNKVLVLVDGRTVYTTGFSGVYWEHVDMPLENIDRIEVIRGPGATVWGANAVNGVINIITKSAKATTGGLLSLSAGTEAYVDGMAQYGGSAGTVGAWRAFGRYFNVRDSLMQDRSEGADGWSRAHGGFRSDWDLSRRDTLTVQGDLFSNRMGETVRTAFAPTPFDRYLGKRYDATGGNLLARWRHTFQGGSGIALQSYHDNYRRTDLDSVEIQRAFDLDFQHHLAAGSRHDIVWGLGFRRSTSAVPPGYLVSLSPPSRTDNLYSAFLQDEIRLANSVWWTIGCKVEHNAHTGVEYEPSARLAWTPSHRTTLWAAASRAIRQPDRMDTSVELDLATYPLDAGTILSLRLNGNPALKTEEVRDYELGFRGEITRTTSIDLAAFLSSYRRLTTIESGPPSLSLAGQSLRVTIPMVYDNRASALDYGGELSLNRKVAPHWRVSSGYSLLRVNVRFDPSSMDTFTRNTLTDVPAHMFQVRSQWEPARRLEFDQWLSWTASLPGTDIPAYARLDARLARRIGESVEVSLVGQNLLRPGTRQFPDMMRVIGSMAERSAYGKITWRF